jgi:beta-glucosidase
MAVAKVRSCSKDAEVGIVLNLGPYYTQTQSIADKFAVRHSDDELNRWFLDPLYGRLYPADEVADFAKMGVLDSFQPSFVKENDFDVFFTPPIFLQINNYTRTIVGVVQGQEMNPGAVNRLPAPSKNETEMGWEIYPQGLYEMVSRVHQEYKPGKILITENGASYSDSPDSTGKVHDQKRIDYLDSHIGAIGKAIVEGIPVMGYYVWSFMDNFEWAFGYAQRFGLVFVDYSTQKRFPKDSAYWYQKVIKQNGIALKDPSF